MTFALVYLSQPVSRSFDEKYTVSDEFCRRHCKLFIESDSFPSCSRLAAKRLLSKLHSHLAYCKNCSDSLGCRLVCHLETDCAIRALNSIIKLVRIGQYVDRTLSWLEHTQCVRNIVGKPLKADDTYNKEDFTAKQQDKVLTF